MSNAAPGWYVQPDGTQQWWDGYQWTNDVVPPAPPKKGHALIWSLVAGGLTLVLIAGIVLAISASKVPHAPAAAATPEPLNSDIVLGACEGAVEKQLKAGQADHYDRETAFEITSKKWTAHGIVYATNSFGAVVPAVFHCTVTDTGPDTVSTHVDELTNIG